MRDDDGAVFSHTYRGSRRYVRLPSHSNSSGAEHTLGSDIYAGFLRRKAVRRVETTTSRYARLRC